MSTVRTLLNKSLFLSISDREFSPIDPSGSQINAAIDTLQHVLDQYRYYITYWSTRKIEGPDGLLDFGAAQVNYVQYLLGTTAYLLIEMNQGEFARVNQIIDLKSIPKYFWHDKQNNLIETWPQASVDNENGFQIGFTPFFDATNINEEISSSITSAFISFLQYEVASQLCDQYSKDWSPKKENSLKKARIIVLNNKDNSISASRKPLLQTRSPAVPWLAYISGLKPN